MRPVIAFVIPKKNTRSELRVFLLWAWTYQYVHGIAPLAHDCRQCSLLEGELHGSDHRATGVIHGRIGITVTEAGRTST